MKFFFAIFLICGYGALTNAQTVESNFMSSMASSSQLVLQRSLAYTQEYQEVASNVSSVLPSAVANLGFNVQSVQATLNSVAKPLIDNVQSVVSNYSPSTVLSFVSQLYISYYNNVTMNIGISPQSFLDLRSAYAAKMAMNPAAANACNITYQQQYLKIYSASLGNFTQLMGSQINSAVSQIENLKGGIQGTATGIMTQIFTIVANPNIQTAVTNLVTFITGQVPVITVQVTQWITTFSNIMENTQRTIMGNTSQLNDNRVSQTVALINLTRTCYLNVRSTVG